MNHWPLASGDRFKYLALEYELFWDYNDLTLYIWHNLEWYPLGGTVKNFKVEAGDNLEVVFDKEDTQYLHPELRLKNNIDIDTLRLGKFSNVPRWKGMRKLGENTGSTFFPIMYFSDKTDEVIGGTFLIKTHRGDHTELGLYHATMSCRGKADIYGSDDQNVKDTINLIRLRSGESYIGFKTFSTPRVQTVNGRVKTTYEPPEHVEVWFNGWDTRYDLIPNMNIDETDIYSSKVLARN